MAPTRVIHRAPPATIPTHTPSMRGRLPPYVRLSLLVALNLFLSSTLWSVTAHFLDNELGVVSKHEEGLGEAMARLAYKICAVYAGWRLNYDYYDIAALTAITTTPHAYLLSTYYLISPITVTALMVNEILAIAIPTFLLRPRSAVNNPNVPLRSRYLLNSSQVSITNVLLAIGVYVVVLFTTFRTPQWRTFLVTHSEIPTLEGAYAETPFSLISKLLVAGLATKNFLLNPSLGATSNPGDATPVEIFNAATATLPQTVTHNVWFFTKRTRTLIQQTTVACLFLFANTLRRGLSLRDTTFVGVAGYASIWIVANVICAGWWSWIGDTEL